MTDNNFTTEEMNDFIIEATKEVLEDLCFGEEKNNIDKALEFMEVSRSVMGENFTYRIMFSVTKDDERVLQTASIRVKKIVE